MPRAINEKLDAVRHVVHDYANLVSSGTMAVAGKHKGRSLTPPINTHVGQTFLLNCRKLDEFFTGRDRRDIHAADFLKGPAPRFKLSSWALWRDPMDKQLMHIGYARVTKPKVWRGQRENELFLKEFKAAWKLFLSRLEEPYQSEFSKQIAERLKSEFAGLDLS